MDTWEFETAYEKYVDRMACFIDPLQRDHSKVDYLELLEREGINTFCLAREISVKANGKKRTICIPSMRDKIRGSTLANALLRDVPLTKTGTLYHGIEGCQHAVKRLKKRHLKGEASYVFKCDLKNYYAHIEHESLLQVIHRSGGKKLIPSISSYLEAPVLNLEGELVRRDKGVIAGNALSNVLAMIYLHDIDKALEAFQPIVMYQRVMDDFLIYGQDEKVVIKAANCLLSFLQEMNLKINEDKTGYFGEQDTFDYLGYKWEKGIVAASNQNVQRMKVRIKKWLAVDNYIDLRKRNQHKKLLNTVKPKIESQINNWAYFFRHISHDNSLKELDSFMVGRLMIAMAGKRRTTSRDYYYDLIKKHGPDGFFQHYRRHNSSP